MSLRSALPACVIPRLDRYHTPISFLVQDLDRDILALVAARPSPPHSDNYLVEVPSSVQVSTSQDRQEFNRAAIGPDRFAIRQPTNVCFRLAPRW